MLPTSIDTQADLDAAREYINAAPTPEERQRRKQELFRALYSNPKIDPLQQHRQIMARKPQNQQELDEWLYTQFMENGTALAFAAGTNHIAPWVQATSLENELKKTRTANEIELRKAQIALIDAVGKAIAVNANLLQGLASTFDSGPRS